MNADRDSLRVYSFTGEARGVRFQCSPTSYVRGKMSLHLETEERNIYKGPAHRLLDALNARWSRRSSYVLTPSRAKLWQTLFVQGWDAATDWRGAYGCKEAPKLESPDGGKMTLKEAIAAVREQGLLVVQPPSP